MLDPKYIRENSEKVKQLIASGRGNPKKANINLWLDLDKQRQELLAQKTELNKKKNELAQIGKEGKVEEIRKKGAQLREESKELEEKLKQVLDKWQEILDWVPNMPISEEAMPVGKGEEDNWVIKAWVPGKDYIKEAERTTVMQTTGFMPTREFAVKHHLDLGNELAIMNNEQSALASGTRFTYLLGDAVKLQYSLQQLVFNELIKREFVPIIPPLLVKDCVLYGTSHLPEGKDQIYRIEAEYVEDSQQLNLVGSSEPANFAYFMDKTLSAEDLPIKLFAYTTCFRSEAGSWGRDTKGIKRVHQFDKIEMNAVCLPEQSEKIFEEFLSVNEWLLQSLKLPYRLVLKCTGDAGYLASAKQIDSEVWLPGQREFMEVMTDTNTTDFQARRLHIKFRTSDGEKGYVHTVNDTGIAMGRMLIAILENYQQADGTIKVPEVLQPYMGKDTIGPSK